MKMKGFAAICAAVLTVSALPELEFLENSIAAADTKAGDINQDGYVDTADIILVQNYISVIVLCEISDLECIFASSFNGSIHRLSVCLVECRVTVLDSETVLNHRADGSVQARYQLW